MGIGAAQGDAIEHAGARQIVGIAALAGEQGQVGERAVAVVTGGGTGIGAAVVRKLAPVAEAADTVKRIVIVWLKLPVALGNSHACNVTG